MIAIDRRNLLQGVAALIGVSALPTDALAAAPARSPARPAVLSAPQQALAAALAETFIPRTDTPGAIQAGVPGKFHALLRDWASAASRTALVGALDSIDAAAKAQTGKAFAALAPAQRLRFLTAYDAANLKSDRTYARLKNLLVALYYLSEPGATVELRYEHAPGAWEPSIPITPATRTWAGA